MGIALPALPQPGAQTSAVLAEVERGWLLIFAMLVLGLTLAESKYAVLFSILFAAAIACSFGLLADCSDLLFGFWPTAGLVLLPMLVFLAWLLTKLAPRPFSTCWLSSSYFLESSIRQSLASIQIARHFTSIWVPWCSSRLLHGN